jgi:SAM-dependent methyltransferase
MPGTKASFGGNMPEHYDRHLGPAQFEPFAAFLAERLPRRPAGDVLEVACGTGLLTRRLRERLDPSVRLVATDLSAGMLEFARQAVGADGGLHWREADAMRLPFADGEFGAVVCGFGLMFVPDKLAALREARRTLKPGGLLLLSVWDRIEEIPHALAGAEVIEGLFPGDPEMRFRVPYELHDQDALLGLLADAGFREARSERRLHRITGIAVRDLATGQIRGTPRSALIEKRGVSLEAAIDKLAARLTQVGGDPYSGQIAGYLVEARALS